MMPVGPILMMILLVLIGGGFLDGALHRLGLSVRSGLLLTFAMLLGSAVEIPLGPHLTVNLGGALIPLAFALYLLVKADQWYEPVRAIAGAGASAAVVFVLGRWFPPGQPTELNLFYLDAQYLFGVTGAIMGYLSGGSRRSAWVAAVGGVMLADLGHYLGLWPTHLAPAGVIPLGGGGFQGTAAVAGILAVALAEWIGDPVREVTGSEHLSGPST